MPLVYQDDIGARLTVYTGNTSFPVTTTITLLIKTPTGTLLTKTPAVNFTTGILTYDTISGDLTTAGEYKVQVRAVFTDGDDLRSNIDSFYVYEKLA